MMADSAPICYNATKTSSWIALSTSMVRETMRQLPSYFDPGNGTVICGRGKACTSSPGNRRLKDLVTDHLVPYSQARNKMEKSTIVSAIIESVKDASSEGGFVKFENGAWWEVENCFAREKIGCLFREALHTKYRSSTKAKNAKKQKMETMCSGRKKTLKARSSGGTVNSSSSSSDDTILSRLPTPSFSFALSPLIKMKSAGSSSCLECMRLPPPRSSSKLSDYRSLLSNLIIGDHEEVGTGGRCSVVSQDGSSNTYAIPRAILSNHDTAAPFGPSYPSTITSQDVVALPQPIQEALPPMIEPSSSYCLSFNHHGGTSSRCSYVSSALREACNLVADIGEDSLLLEDIPIGEDLCDIFD